MNFDVSAFNRIRPGIYPLKEWKSPAPPRRIEDLFRALKSFARYMGLKDIPANTVEKLRTDPYFRYVFCRLRDHSAVYGPLPMDRETRERLAEVLRNPEALKDRDLYMGLAAYMNNFTGYFPGEHKRVYLERNPEFRVHMADTVARLEAVIRDVDAVLKELGVAEKIVTLMKEVEEERSNEIDDLSACYRKRVEFMKIALAAFNIMVERHGYPPQELWT